MQNAFQRTQRSRINSSSARVNTLPVGLFGVLRIIAFVCGPNAAANSFSSYDQKEFSSAGGRILSKGGGAPLRIASGPEIFLKRSETTIFLPGFVMGLIARILAFVVPPPIVVSAPGVQPIPL